MILQKKGWLETSPAFYKEVFLVALPVAFQQAINIGVNLMDTVMVGALGETSLSASSLANQYYYLYYILCLGISGGTCVLSAQYWGAGNHKARKQIWRLAMYIAGGAAVLFAIVTYLFPEQIMTIYTNDQGMIREGSRYLKITVFVFFFHGTSMIMVNLLRTAGVLPLGMIVSGVSFFVNIFFNYVFIFGKFGAPRMEIAGAALGTLISRFIEFVITFGYLYLKREKVAFYPRDLIGKPDGRILKVFADTGLPVIISDGMFTLGENVLSMILGHMSAAIVSGNAITMTTMRLCTVFVAGLSGGAAVTGGQAVGRGEKEEVQRQGQTYYLIAVIVGILGGVIIWTASPFIVNMYQLSPETKDVTMQLMHTMSFLMVFQSVQSIMSKGVLRGGGDTRFLVFADIVFLWILNIPLGFLTGMKLGLAPWLVFVCLRLDSIVKTFLCLWRLLTRRWIRNIN